MLKPGDKCPAKDCEGTIINLRGAIRCDCCEWRMSRLPRILVLDPEDFFDHVMGPVSGRYVAGRNGMEPKR